MSRIILAKIMVDLKNYDYHLPKSLIAQKPAVPRDFSKLFVYDTKKEEIFFDRFYYLDRYLPKNSFLVLNNSKVLPAKAVLQKETGGLVEILFLVNEIKDPKNFSKVKGLADKKITVGQKLFFNKKDFVRVCAQKENIFTFSFDFAPFKFLKLLQRYGRPPIPLYLKKTPLKKEALFKKYQTIFAKKEGSVAAPTASLHFTNRLFKKLEQKGIKWYFVTLHVGLGTFAKVTEENLRLKKLHKEYYEIEKPVFEKIIKEKEKGKKLVAVGTTVVRTLESAVKNGLKNPKLMDETSLFIFPPFDFKMVDVLITNFHLPKSSLMMLVEAFLKYKKAKKTLVELYNIAIKNNFRFYSFGDGMVII